MGEVHSFNDRELRMDASTRFDTARVGAMPLIAAMFDEIGLRSAVNELVPYEGDVDLGTLVEVMVLNRLLQPKAMFKMALTTLLISYALWIFVTAIDAHLKCQMSLWSRYLGM